MLTAQELSLAPRKHWMPVKAGVHVNLKKNLKRFKEGIEEGK